MSGTTTFSQRRVTYSLSLSLTACLPFSHSLSLIFNPPFVPPSPLFFCRLAVKHRKLWPLHNNPFAGGCWETAWRPMHKQQIGPLTEGKVRIHRRLCTQTNKQIQAVRGWKTNTGVTDAASCRWGATWTLEQSAGFNNVLLKSLSLIPACLNLCSI